MTAIIKMWLRLGNNHGHTSAPKASNGTLTETFFLALFLGRTASNKYTKKKQNETFPPDKTKPLTGSVQLTVA